MTWTEFSDDMSRGVSGRSAREREGAQAASYNRSWRRSSNRSRARWFDLLFGRKHGFTGWSIGKRALDKKLGLKPWTHTTSDGASPPA